MMIAVIHLIIGNGITIDHEDLTTTYAYPAVLKKCPAFTSFDPISYLVSTADTVNPTQVAYGISAGASAVSRNKETLYFKDIQMYKGSSEVVLNANNAKRFASVH